MFWAQKIITPITQWCTANSRTTKLYQFTKVRQHFCELKIKPRKGFKNTKWRSHFVFWYYSLCNIYSFGGKRLVCNGFKLSKRQNSSFQRSWNSKSVFEKSLIQHKLLLLPPLIPPYKGYRVHTSLTVYVSIDLSPLNPPILEDFERILFSCSPRIGGQGAINC